MNASEVRTRTVCLGGSAANTLRMSRPRINPQIFFSAILRRHAYELNSL